MSNKSKTQQAAQQALAKSQSNHQEKTNPMSNPSMNTSDPVVRALIHRLIRQERAIAALAKHSVLQSDAALQAYTKTPVGEQDVRKYLEKIQIEAANDAEAELRLIQLERERQERETLARELKQSVTATASS